MPKAQPKSRAKKTSGKPQPAQGGQAPGAAKKRPATEREVVYSEVKARLYVGDGELTAADARKLIGWLEEKEGESFGSDYSLMDTSQLGGKEHGVKVRLLNNPGNRPFDRALARLWESEILKRRWRLNGETLIIGRTGMTISAQHRLVGLILAAQEWHLHPDRWPDWQVEPTMPAVIVFGIDESDATVNTIDTGKPRSLADVIFRSEYFAGMRGKERAEVARMTAYAVKLLWNRTGAGIDAFSNKRSHSDSLDFLARHERLLKAVRHIWEEDNSKGAVAKYLSPGYAAAMLYLMAASETDPAEYREAETPGERQLSFSRWDAACDFWVSVAGGARELEALTDALGRMIADESASVGVRTALVVKAWNTVAAGRTPDPDDLALDFEEDGPVRRLVDHPTVGGVDLGEEREADPEVTEEEVEATKAQIRTENGDRFVPKPTPRYGKPQPAAPRLELGCRVWVTDEDGEVWFGTLKQLPDGGQCRVLPDRQFAPEGVKAVAYEVLESAVSLTDPGA